MKHTQGEWTHTLPFKKLINFKKQNNAGNKSNKA